jgi:glycine/D-amino acid oxidase-like deaminating enzyme/nitrite reductase/ring-hydroxylating ferredoxin subunit
MIRTAFFFARPPRQANPILLESALMKKQSLWIDTSPPKDFPQLQGRVNVDVLVIGGGITGLTTAYLLKKAGRRVAVVDQQNIGEGETSHTTGHLTFVTDERLNKLASRLGEKEAQAFWGAGRLAMQQIAEITSELDIDCELRRVPGYLFAAVGKDLEKEAQSLKDDALLAETFGFDTDFMESDPLFGRPAVRFPNQLKFHPLKYVSAIAKALHGGGCHVFSRTSGSNIDSREHELHADGGVIGYECVVAATHVPIQGERDTFGAALFQTKLAAYSTYAIEAEIKSVAESLFWDTNDPYLYLRFDQRDGRSSVIIGGEDHKTGQDQDTEARYKRLESSLRKTFSDAKLKHRWSGQVLETPDRLPYIGEVAERQFLATGFSGNGLTLGTFSAVLIRDLITGKSNPWTGLFAPGRKALAGFLDYVRENKDFLSYFIKDWLRPAPPAESLHRGTGDVLNLDGKKRAVYCDEHGKRTVLSPICPHMGCIVAWNQAEKTWDCPCHGSRFTATGEVIAGPAESNLEPK